MKYLPPNNEDLNMMSAQHIPVVTPSSVEPLNIDMYADHGHLNRMIIKMYIDSINSEQEVIAEMRQTLLSAPDPDMASSLAALEKSVGDKMKMLTEIVMQKERIISQEKIKTEDNVVKKEIAAGKNTPKTLSNGEGGPQVWITSRKDLLKMLDDKEKVVDGRVDESIDISEE